jgi:heptaprenyl diphosphate synthase
MVKIGIPDIDPKLEKDLLASMAEVEVLLRGSIEGKYPLVIETSRHLVDAGGKRLRPLLTLIASHFGDPKAHGIIEAAVVCELTHLGTLYHDDVMDEAPLRRGVESANNRWNNTVAILTGDYLFAKTSQLLADLGPEAVRLQALTFERLVIGQIMETQGSSTNKTALEHYLSVVSDKTASLISASARYGAMISGADEKLGLFFSWQMTSSILRVIQRNQAKRPEQIFARVFQHLLLYLFWNQKTQQMLN